MSSQMYEFLKWENKSELVDKVADIVSAFSETKNSVNTRKVYLQFLLWLWLLLSIIVVSILMPIKLIYG